MPKPTISLCPGGGRLGLPYWLAVPEVLADDSTPLVAIHGIQRRADQQAELLASTTLAMGRPLIAPLFDEATWPHYQQVVRKGRADLALLGLLQELRLMGIWQTPQIELSGFSGGAQFAHRFTMLYPQLVRSLTVTAAGWYTFPDDRPFPYGLGVQPDRKIQWGSRIETQLDDFLRVPIRIAVGALDNKTDENTRSGSRIDKQQGVHRLERAQRWGDALIECASERQLPSPSIAFAVLPDSGHDFSECIHKGGLEKLLPDARPSVLERSKASIAGAPSTNFGAYLLAHT